MAPTASHHRVMRQSAVILTFGWLLAPLQFLTAIIVARAVGPEGKGSLALLTGATAILVSIVGFGIPSGAAALYPRDARNRSNILATALTLTAAASSLALLLYAVFGLRLLGVVLSERDMATMDPAWALLAVLAVPPAALAAVADVVLIAANAMRTYSLRAAASGVLGVALTVVLTLQLDWGVAGALAAYPVAACAGLVIFAWWWWKQDALWPARVRLSCARALMHVGIQQHAIAIVALVAKRIDVFLVAGMLSLQDAGFYAAGILIPQAIITVPRATMWPMVSALSGENSQVSDAVARISRLQVAFMIVVALLLAPLAPVVVRFLFGEAFFPAVSPFRWALIGIPFTPLTITVNAILTARTRPGLSIVASVIGTGIQLALALLLIPVWGAAGSAAALSANFFVTAMIQLAIARAEGISPRALALVAPHDIGLLLKALRARVAAW
jgi:O-antigen/teichoic acid export membrane protein